MRTTKGEQPALRKDSRLGGEQSGRFIVQQVPPAHSRVRQPAAHANVAQSSQEQPTKNQRNTHARMQSTPTFTNTQAHKFDFDVVTYIPGQPISRAIVLSFGGLAPAGKVSHSGHGRRLTLVARQPKTEALQL